MKGNEKVINVLNGLLADELTAINQYMVHSEVCENWRYNKLHKAIQKHAMEEMRHAEWLIERVVFLAGMPIVNKLNQIKIGRSIMEMINNDKYGELEAIRAYNDGIRISREAGDEGTAELLNRILKMEETHLEWGDAQTMQMEQMGIENYLSLQSEGGDI